MPVPGEIMRVEFVSELVGTFFMVFIGCMAIKQELGGPIISLAFGGAVCLVIMASRKYSGAHINPAVSIAFSLTGELEKRLLPAYLTAQLIGGLLAGLLVGNSGATDFATSIDLGITIEVIITFTLMMSIYLTIWHTDNDYIVGIVVGLVVAVLAFFFGPYTGASMNPARTLGPNIASGLIEVIPIYFAATIIGAVVAAGLRHKLGNPPVQSQ